MIHNKIALTITMMCFLFTGAPLSTHHAMKPTPISCDLASITSEETEEELTGPDQKEEQAEFSQNTSNPSKQTTKPKQPFYKHRYATWYDEMNQ